MNKFKRQFKRDKKHNKKHYYKNRSYKKYLEKRLEFSNGICIILGGASVIFLAIALILAIQYGV